MLGLLPMSLSTAGSPLCAFHLAQALLRPVFLQPEIFVKFWKLWTGFEEQDIINQLSNVIT